MARHLVLLNRVHMFLCNVFICTASIIRAVLGAIASGLRVGPNFAHLFLLGRDHLLIVAYLLLVIGQLHLNQVVCKWQLDLLLVGVNFM